MSGFVDRENEIFEVLQCFKSEGLDFVVVGGYGVSAYEHRFSVDADLVIPSDEVEEFIEVLEELGFKEDTDRELVYGGRFLAYDKEAELPVSIDLLVDELQCRQTDASWSYPYFREHSVEKTIEGSERQVRVRVPTEELLIAVKLHSGRLTDTRDVIALIEDADMEVVDEHIRRGDPEKLRQVLENVGQTASESEFEDAFKGVFSRSAAPDVQIQKLQEFIQRKT